MNPLIVIPARGGSIRLPGKNIKPLNGKPLIHYTIEAAREVFNDNVICVSTDDQEIRKVTEKTGLGVPFIRPYDLATDTTDSRSVLLHAYNFYKNEMEYKADTVVLLQPTSPFRKANHIKEALELYQNDLDMVVSVKETESNPYAVLYEENSDGYLEKSKNGNFTRKQDYPKVWELNGAIYIINSKSILQNQVSEFKKIIKYKMTSKDSIDIDTALDFDFATFLMQNR